jgi:hypothetical protein
MFYHALREGGVSEAKALLMYYAVVVGAKHWKKIDAGISCPIGKYCLRNLGPDIVSLGGELDIMPDGEVVVFWPETFEDPNFLADLQSVESMIADGAVQSLDAIEELAATRHPEKPLAVFGDTMPYLQSDLPSK